jgi:hypothetical protein
MNQNGIDVQVCVENRPIREFGYQGRTIVEGRRGTPFTIKVRNNHPTRVHAAVMVDGVGVVSGKSGDLKGYILEPYSSYEVKGWRTSNEEVARFIFETKSGSYSKAVKGNDAQCGVITVVAYAEKIKPQVIEKHHHHDHHHFHEKHIHHDNWPYRRPYYPWDHPTIFFSSTGGAGGGGLINNDSVSSAEHVSSFAFNVVGTKGPNGPKGPSGEPGMMRSATKTRKLSACCLSDAVSYSADSIPTVTASSSAEVTMNFMNLGTGWGAAEQDSVREVQWENGVTLASMELFYTDADGLKTLGIDTSKAPSLPLAPSFPTGFCRPPHFEYAEEPVKAAPAPQPEVVKKTKKSATKTRKK